MGSILISPCYLLSLLAYLSPRQKVRDAHLLSLNSLGEFFSNTPFLFFVDFMLPVRLTLEGENPKEGQIFCWWVSCGKMTPLTLCRDYILYLGASIV